MKYQLTYEKMPRVGAFFASVGIIHFFQMIDVLRTFAQLFCSLLGTYAF